MYVFYSASVYKVWYNRGTLLILLCCTMDCFHVISISLISGGDHPVLITVCGYYPYVHYCYVPWLIMTSQWILTHYDITMDSGTTMGNDVARDIHCDATMDNDVAMCT